ncbi:hypothetical protein BC938DRAFT_479245 [Jimgerdemannia flammicorona]|uniref:Uncharacterized protein n=1 Tax=Jimgerdemannia flammicorona TaxID=994334 RepID=A0A433QLA3_9FUNG|nr:hypothetical protein BC938DRAFT_479245 [Jimgerdemannia flammicorona]
MMGNQCLRSITYNVSRNIELKQPAAHDLCFCSCLVCRPTLLVPMRYYQSSNHNPFPYCPTPSRRCTLPSGTSNTAFHDPLVIRFFLTPDCLQISTRD